MFATWTFRNQRFLNQELTYQSLYKAQNLGFYKNIYADDLIRRYAGTVTKADQYSRAKDCRQALSALAPDADTGPVAALPEVGKKRVTLAAPSNLQSLALIAGAHLGGWSLVIEDCPFTQRFLQPLARRLGRRMEFQPFSLIPRLIRATAGGAAPASGCLFVTFPDRPFDSIKGSLTVKLLGQDYLLSIAEALLTRAKVDHVLRLGRRLEEIEHPAGGATAIKGEDLLRITAEQAAALEEAILAAPIDYLGWTSLYSRNRLYFDLVNANRRNFFQSLLRHSQQQGLALPPDIYAGFMEQFERTKTKAPA